jgi:hypothetical protein
MTFFKRRKKKNYFLKAFKHRRQSWIWHIVMHNQFVANILEGANPEKKLWEDLDRNT